jgi:hypothetical protein
MKILITGATGLVGQILIKKLLSEGHDISFLTSRKNAVNSLEGCKGYYWNIKEQLIDVSCIAGVEKIIHLAGANVSNSWSDSYKNEIINSRVHSSKLLFETLKRNTHQVNQLVSASAIGIYKNSLTTVYNEESAVFSEAFLGEVVQKWEASVSVFSTLNIKVAKVRIGVVLSSTGGALEKIIQPIKWGLGAPLDSGNQVMSWIHISDLSQLIVFLMQENKNGVFNAVAPNPVTNSELTKKIASKLKKPLFLPNVPKFVLKLMLGEMHQIVCESQNVSSEKVENNGFSFKYKTIDRALDSLL